MDIKAHFTLKFPLIGSDSLKMVKYMQDMPYEFNLLYNKIIVSGKFFEIQIASELSSFTNIKINKI